MWTDAVTLLDDVSAADWIAPRLTGEPGFVAGTVPAGFDAYARILHPVDGDGRVRTWAEIAATTGRVVHPEVQWHALIGAADPWSREGWHEGEPQQGNLALAQLLALTDILAEHTTTPDDCAFALWEGWGQLNVGARSMMRMEAMETPGSPWRRMLPRHIFRRRARGTPVPPVIAPREFKAAPRLRLPDRDHLLFRGPLSAVEAFARYDGAGTPFTQSPQLLWAADRAWCVATEIDFPCTLVGGSEAAIEAVLASPFLEALPLTGAESLRHDADHVNP